MAFVIPVTSGTGLACEVGSNRVVTTSTADLGSAGAIAPSPCQELIVIVRRLHELIAGEISATARETTGSGEASATYEPAETEMSGAECTEADPSCPVSGVVVADPAFVNIPGAEKACLDLVSTR